jgi:hypothetical protein
MTVPFPQADPLSQSCRKRKPDASPVEDLSQIAHTAGRQEKLAKTTQAELDAMAQVSLSSMLSPSHPDILYNADV